MSRKHKVEKPTMRKPSIPGKQKPSIKSLDAAFPDKGKILRQLLDSPTMVRCHPAVVAWVRECYLVPTLAEQRLCALNSEAGTSGVEYVPEGHNRKSPSFHYLNTGDPYTPTIIRINGGYCKQWDSGRRTLPSH